MALLPKITSMIATSYAGQVAAATGTAFTTASDHSKSGDQVAGANTVAGRYHVEGAAAAVGVSPMMQPRAALSCLRVLCAVAGRAPWAAERVAREPGLLDVVREVRVLLSLELLWWSWWSWLLVLALVLSLLVLLSLAAAVASAR